MRKNRRIIRRPSSANTGFISIHDIPAEQRGSFYVWLTYHDKLLTLHTKNQSKSDELDLVEGCEWNVYLEWYDNWDGILTYPSMIHNDTKVSMTVLDCDKELYDAENKIVENPNEETLFLKAKLMQFMLEPYKHETVTLYPSPVVYSWYELEKSMEQVYLLMKQNSAYGKLFQKLKDISKKVSNGILLNNYNYKNK